MLSLMSHSLQFDPVMAVSSPIFECTGEVSKNWGPVAPVWSALQTTPIVKNS